MLHKLAFLLVLGAVALTAGAFKGASWAPTVCERTAVHGRLSGGEAFWVYDCGQGRSAVRNGRAVKRVVHWGPVTQSWR